MHGRSAPARRRVGSDQAGSATVWVVACLFLLVAAVGTVSVLAAVAAVRHRVADTADEAALAAAAALPAPATVACAQAGRVATAGLGRLDSCTLEPGGCAVRVEVSRAAPGLLAVVGRVRARARAGSSCRDAWLNRAARTGDETTERTVVDLSLQTRPEGDKTVVSVAGEIDVYTAPKLREQIVQLVEEGRYHLVVDMEEVEFLDSTGLGVLVGGLKRVRAHDGSLHLVCTQERILKIFRITGLTKVFPVHATVADAVAAQD